MQDVDPIIAVAGQLTGATISGAVHATLAAGRAGGKLLYHAGVGALEMHRAIQGDPETGDSPAPTPSPVFVAEKKKRGRKPKDKTRSLPPTPGPEASHEPKGPVGRPKSQSRRWLEARPDENKPEGTTRSGSSYRPVGRN